MSHSMSHCALKPIGFHYISRDHPNAHELTNHILHPSRPAVAGRIWKVIAQAVRNGSGVTDRNHRQFSKDTFNGDDVENWILVVELV